MHPLLDGLLQGNNFGAVPQIPEALPTVGGIGGSSVPGIPVSGFTGGRGLDNVGLGPGVNPLAFLAILYIASKFTRPAQIVQPIYIIDSARK